MNVTPPRLADKFLEWFCAPELLEDLQGDLYEIFESKAASRSIRYARFYYWWLVIRSFRYSAIKRSRSLNTTTMTTNHLKIAWRLMLRHKLHTALNVAGLVLGISCFVLLSFFVTRELSFDSFHKRSDDIYRVLLKEDYGEGQEFFNAVTPLIFHGFLSENFDQLEEVVQVARINSQVSTEDQRFNEQIAVLSPGFFHVFDFAIDTRGEKNVLSMQDAILLSESYAKKYFGSEDPVGKILTIRLNDESRDFTVRGIMDELPPNTGFHFDMAISNLNNPVLFSQRALEAWFNVNAETYVMLKENSGIASVEESMPQTVMNILGDRVQAGEYNILFQPLADIHLDESVPTGIMPVGNKAEVYILAGIALLVLIIACLNYITMSLAQSVTRFKEVGVRKVMGAFRSSLIRQHLIESTLLVGISTIIGVILAWGVVPLFNNLTDAGVVLTFHWWHIPLIAGLILTLSLLSGFYPGVILARWRTTEVLQGKVKTGRNHLFRRGIVIFQFMVTAFLISSTIIMNRQLEYVQTSDLGVNTEATISAQLPPYPDAEGLTDMIRKTMDNGQIVINELNQLPNVSNVAIGTHAPGTNGWASIGFRDKTDVFREARLLVANPEYFTTFAIPLTEGRNFEPENPADASQAVILNETAVKYFSLTDPIGKQLPNEDFGDHSIIGVVKDFHFSSLHNQIEPLIIVENPDIIFQGVSDMGFGESPVPKIVFKYSGKPISDVVNVLENVWEDVFPDGELAFDIVEENMRYQYASERRMQQMMLAATILSIVIACLGLLGLTILIVNGKQKEIGIRKVMGASSLNIFGSLTGRVAIQLLIGFALSIPVAYWLMNQWLDNFAYHIPLTAWQFLISGFLALAVALLVISYHTFRASRNNPVTSLRSE